MIIIYKEEKNGKFEFTKKELENILEQARKEGYDEGYKDCTREYSITTILPTITDADIQKIDLTDVNTLTTTNCTGVPLDEVKG